MENEDPSFLIHEIRGAANGAVEDEALGGAGGDGGDGGGDIPKKNVEPGDVPCLPWFAKLIERVTCAKPTVVVVPGWKGAGHRLETGDSVRFKGVIGMVAKLSSTDALQDKDYVVTVIDDNTFTLNDSDSSDFTPFESGTMEKVVLGERFTWSIVFQFVDAKSLARLAETHKAAHDVCFHILTTWRIVKLRYGCNKTDNTCACERCVRVYTLLGLGGVQGDVPPPFKPSAQDDAPRPNCDFKNGERGWGYYYAPSPPLHALLNDDSRKVAGFADREHMVTPLHGLNRIERIEGLPLFEGSRGYANMPVSTKSVPNASNCVASGLSKVLQNGAFYVNAVSDPSNLLKFSRTVREFEITNVSFGEHAPVGSNIARNQYVSIDAVIAGGRELVIVADCLSNNVWFVDLGTGAVTPCRGGGGRSRYGLGVGARKLDVAAGGGKIFVVDASLNVNCKGTNLVRVYSLLEGDAGVSSGSYLHGVSHMFNSQLQSSLAGLKSICFDDGQVFVLSARAEDTARELFKSIYARTGPLGVVHVFTPYGVLVKNVALSLSPPSSNLFVGLVVRKRIIYVVDTNRHQIYLLSLDTGAELATLGVAEQPVDVCIDGDIVYVLTASEVCLHAFLTPLRATRAAVGTAGNGKGGGAATRGRKRKALDGAGPRL